MKCLPVSVSKANSSLRFPANIKVTHSRYEDNGGTLAFYIV